MRQVLVPRDVAPLIELRAPGAPVITLRGEAMGTTWSVKLVRSAGVSAEALRSAIERLLDGVIREMSPWIGESDISQFNNAAAGTWHTLPAEFLTVLRHALSVAELSGGAYDPTAGALVDVWGFGPHGYPDVPDAESIAAARKACGWKRIRLDGAQVLQPGGVRLDLSSIAKGFAADKISAHLTMVGVPDHLVEVGGELIGHGTKPNGTPWWVALEQPDAGNIVAQASETIVALHGLAIATSGDDQRYFERGGKRLSHTIDPRTGYPVSGKVASVTVLHRCCMQADALATALLVLGAEEGFALAVTLDLAARFVLRGPAGLDVTMTPAMASMLD